MQGRKVAIFLVMIFVISIIPITKIGINRAETITTSVKWSGIKDINDDIIIKSGAQLTIEAGSTININSDISISVEGILIIEGTISDEVNILADLPQQSELGKKSIWEGIQIQSTGVAEINRMNLNGSRAGIFTDVGSISNIQNTTISDSIQGLVNFGTSEVSNLVCEDIQDNCLNNEGAIAAEQINSNNSGVLLKHIGSGIFSNLVALNTGSVVEVFPNASGIINSINATNSGLVLRAYGDQSGMTYSEIESNFATQLFDFSNSESLTINDVQGTSIDSVLLANSVKSLEINNMVISDSESVGLAMEISTSDTVTISNATIYGYGQTFLFSGGGYGTFNLDDTTFFSNGKVGQLSSSLLSSEDGDWDGSYHGLHTQYSEVTLKNMNISVGENHGTALRILGGNLSVLGELNLTHEAQWADTTSIGLQMIWSYMIGESVNIGGFSTGVSCETTSTVDIDYLSILDNTDIGYFQACLESQIDVLTTNSGDYGLYSKTGLISITDWTASSHTSSLLFSELTANTYIRNWEGSGFTFAAQGEATELFYGTSTINENLIQVNNAEKYFETNIEITDLSGENPLEGIVVSVHKFNEVSNIDGTVILPLVSEGSDVYAIDSVESISRLKSLSTNDINPRIELPVLPLDGSNWIIGSGVNIALDDFFGELLSNITIQDGGSLNLINSYLSALNVTVEGGGILTGSDSHFNAEGFSIDSPHIGSGSSSLILQGAIDINCIDTPTISWYGITLIGDITFEGCELSLFGGGVFGETSIESSESSIIKFSNLFVSVVDKGEPIEFASVSLDGTEGNNEITSAITDLDGIANLRAKSITYNSSGVFEDENLDRIVTMQIDSLGVSQTDYWDVSYSSEKSFIASTVNSDEVFNYLNLGLEWSPYYLLNDLVVSGLMEIDDGVDLQISSNKGIIIEGQLNIGSASLHGNDWSGLLVDGGEINLDGSYLFNAIQSITLQNSAIAELGNITLQNSIDGHLMVSSGSSVNLVDSSLELGDNCIKTANDPEISLNIHSTNISSCNVGIRTTGAQISFNQISMYGLDTGIRTVEVVGTIQNIIMGEIESHGLEILDQTNQLLISNIDIESQSIALSIEDSIGVQITDSQSSNIDLIRSSVILTNLISDEINVDGSRAFENIIMENIVATTLNAIGNSGQSCISLKSSIINLILLNDMCMNMVGGQVVDLTASSTYSIVSTLENTDVNTMSVTGLAELTLSSTHYFAATLDGEIVNAIFNLTQESEIHSTSFIGAQNKSIIWKKITSEGEVNLENATLSISFTGALPTSINISLGPTSSIATVVLESNPSPIVTIVLPEGLDKISQGSTTTYSGSITEINYTATDIHGIDSVTWYLVNLETEEAIILESDSAYALSELEEGEYSISLIVIDSYNAMTVVTELFTITPPDNDRDDIETCVSELWWDDQYQRHCGPDNADKDDDNDGIADTLDSFPFDSCAHKDTDSDGSPDNIIENCETSLIIDEDADGNGIEDVKEVSVEGDEGTSNGGIFIWTVLLLVIGSALFRRFKSSEV